MYFIPLKQSKIDRNTKTNNKKNNYLKFGKPKISNERKTVNKKDNNHFLPESNYLTEIKINK